MYKFLTFSRGRDCLRFLINKFKIKEMYIPYYLCDVVRHTLFEEFCKPIFYHIDDNFMPTVEFPKESFVLYPNYFGVFSENVEKLALKYPKLIIDNAHAFYEKPSGFAGFNSGIKFGYINRAEVWFDNDSNSYIECSENEFESDKQRRKKSFVKLHKKYSSVNLLNINPSEEFYPFCYPLLMPTIKSADELVKHLKNEGLTIYRYWNMLPQNYNEYKFYSRLIPIPLL